MSVAVQPQLPDTACVVRAALYANALSARYYGLPVMLVGSALRDPDPRDIDIVIPVPDDLFLAMYGDRGDSIATCWLGGAWAAADALPKLWVRWARDCAKHGRDMTLFCRRQVDFKTQPQSYFDSMAAKPSLRLDINFMGTPL